MEGIHRGWCENDNIMDKAKMEHKLLQSEWKTLMSKIPQALLAKPSTWNLNINVIWTFKQGWVSMSIEGIIHAELSVNPNVSGKNSS